MIEVTDPTAEVVDAYCSGASRATNASRMPDGKFRCNWCLQTDLWQEPCGECGKYDHDGFLDAEGFICGTCAIGAGPPSAYQAVENGAVLPTVYEPDK
jgi:hypothetical protein